MDSKRLQWLDATTLRVETYRSGFFVFQAGVDIAALQPLLDRVQDAQDRFRKVPVLPDVAEELEREVLASSVFGTNTIEGLTLSEEETARVLASNLDPASVGESQHRAVLNMKAAYKLMQQAATEWRKQSQATPAFLPEFCQLLHKMITQGLPMGQNIPGEYRNNAKGQVTVVGNAEHGGRYRPPKCRDDIEMLMKALALWWNSDGIAALPALVRASLLHLHFELIHPFWDGNGRVGRVLEAFMLQASGYRYAPFALANYYLEHIHKYFALFNSVRRRAEKKEATPNQAFIAFFLQGMMEVTNRLHDRVCLLISSVLYQVRIDDALRKKLIKERQYLLVKSMMTMGRPMTTPELFAQPWHQALYKKLSDRTKARDLDRLKETSLVLSKDGRWLPNFPFE